MISQLAFTIAATIYNCMLNIFEISLFLLQAAARIPMSFILNLSLLLTKCLQTVCSSILKLSRNASLIALNVMLNVFSILNFILVHETTNLVYFLQDLSYFMTTLFLKAGSFLLENVSSITIGMRGIVSRIVNILRTTDLSERNNLLSSKSLQESDNLIFPEEVVEKETKISETCSKYKQGSVNTGILITNMGCGKEITITCERNTSDQIELSSEYGLDCKSKTISVSPRKNTYPDPRGEVKDYENENSLSFSKLSEQNLEQTFKSNSSDSSASYIPEESKSIDSLKLDFSKSACSYSFDNKEIPDYSNILELLSSEEIERSTYYTEKRRKTESEEYVPLWHDNKDDSLRRHKSVHRKDLDKLAQDDESSENASSLLNCESQTIINSKKSDNLIEICSLEGINHTENFTSDSSMTNDLTNSLEVGDCFKVMTCSETAFKDLVGRGVNFEEEINTFAATVSSAHLPRQYFENDKSISVKESKTEEKNDPIGELVFPGDSKAIGDVYHIPDSNEKLIDSDTENSGTIDNAFKFLDEETFKSIKLEEIIGEKIVNERTFTDGCNLVSLIPKSMATETAIDCYGSSLYDEVSLLRKGELKLDILEKSNTMEFTESENSNKSIVSVHEISEEKSYIDCDKNVSDVAIAETSSSEKKLVEIEDIDVECANRENKNTILLNKNVDNLIQATEKTQLIACTFKSETNLESNESSSVEYAYQCLNESESISVDTKPSEKSETKPKPKIEVIDIESETCVVSSGEDSTEIINRTNNILNDEMSVITTKNDGTDKNIDPSIETVKLENEGTHKRKSFEEYSEFLSISEFDDVFVSVTDELVEKIAKSETTQHNSASPLEGLGAMNDTEVKQCTPQYERNPFQLNEYKDGMSFSITDKFHDAVLFTNEKKYPAQNFEQKGGTHCTDRCSVAVELEEKCDAEYELNYPENCAAEDSLPTSKSFPQHGLCDLKLEREAKDFKSSVQPLKSEVSNESSSVLVETTMLEDLDPDLMRTNSELTLEQSETFQSQSLEEKPLELNGGEQYIESIKDINCSLEDGNVQELDDNSKEGTIDNEQKTSTSGRKKKNRRRRKH